MKFFLCNLGLPYTFLGTLGSIDRCYVFGFLGTYYGETYRGFKRAVSSPVPPSVLQSEKTCCKKNNENSTSNIIILLNSDVTCEVSQLSILDRHGLNARRVPVNAAIHCRRLPVGNGDSV